MLEFRVPLWVRPLVILFGLCVYALVRAAVPATVKLHRPFSAIIALSDAFNRALCPLPLRVAALSASSLFDPLFDPSFRARCWRVRRAAVAC
jgi:hypothetical protein